MRGTKFLMYADRETQVWCRCWIINIYIGYFSTSRIEVGKSFSVSRRSNFRFWLINAESQVEMEKKREKGKKKKWKKCKIRELHRRCEKRFIRT